MRQIWVMCTCILAIAVLFSLATAQSGLAQASLAAENTVDDLTVSYVDEAGARQNIAVTLVRDAREINQWYYVPGAPTLATTRMGIQTVPQFSMLRYDYRDVENPQTVNRAGLLNFAVRLSLPPEALPALRAAVQAKLGARFGAGVAAQLRISALPINSATVGVFSPDSKLAGAAEGTGTAPTFASQQMAFSVPLTDVGVPVFDALTNSATGLPISIQYTYYGLTPPAGFKIKINYRNALEHYSKDEKFRARASYYGFVGVSVASDATSIREELIGSGAMEVTILDGPNFSMNRVDAYLQPILKRINDQILENAKPPPPIAPAAAGAPDASGFFGGAGYTVATKNVSQLKTLSEEIDFRQQTIVERTTAVSGFIGIGKYPAPVRQALAISVDGTAFPSAYVAFPQIPASIQRVQLEVSLRARGKTFATRTYLHELNGTWVDIANGKPADRIGFSLAAVEQEFGKPGLADAQLAIRKTISTIEDSVTFTDVAPATEGASAVNLRDNVAGLRLRGSQLTFRQLGGDLVRLELTVESPQRRKSYTFEPISANGVWTQPPDEYFLTPAAEAGQQAKLTARLVFASGAARTVTQNVTIERGFGPVYLDSFLATGN